MTMVLPRTSLMIFAAASLAGATMTTRPAAATPAAGAPVAQAAGDAALATQAQWRGGYGRGYGHRGGYYGRGYYGAVRLCRGWGYGGAAAAAGIAGLATGAILGGALSQPHTTVIEEPGYAYGRRRICLLRPALPVLRPGQRHLPGL